jgi:hypothetical protein
MADKIGDGYLSAIIVANNLKRLFHLSVDTVLHRGKDLAVAPSLLPAKLTLTLSREGARLFRILASLFAPLRPAIAV